jgi:hypothetical protein
VRLSRDEHTLYATCGPDEIAVVDLGADPWTVRKVLLPGGLEAASCQRCPYALGVSPDGLVWVSSIGSAGRRGGIDIYDPSGPGGGDFDVTRSVTLTGAALFASFTGTAADYRVYIPEQGLAGDRLRVFAPGGPGTPPRELMSLLLSAQDCLNAHMLHVSADERGGHLVCEGNHSGPGTLVWLELDPPAVLASAPIGVFPDGVVLMPPLRPGP